MCRSASIGILEVQLVTVPNRAGGVRRGENRKILVVDVSRAHFRPKSRREQCIRLPAEDSKSGHVGKLLRTLYGTRDAAKASDECFNNAAIDQGYDIGLSSPCLHYHRGEDIEGEDNWLDELQKAVERVVMVDNES